MRAQPRELFIIGPIGLSKRQEIVVFAENDAPLKKRVGHLLSIA
jgi:hypothetical protein